MPPGSQSFHKPPNQKEEDKDGGSGRGTGWCALLRGCGARDQVRVFDALDRDGTPRLGRAFVAPPKPAPSLKKTAHTTQLKEGQSLKATDS